VAVVGTVDFNVADFHGARRERSFEAAEHGFDASNKFAWAERFGDVVVGTEFESKNAVGLAALRGQKDDGDRGQACGLADGAADFQSVFAGDHDVEDEQRRPRSFRVS